VLKAMIRKSGSDRRGNHALITAITMMPRSIMPRFWAPSRSPSASQTQTPEFREILASSKNRQGPHTRHA
jgi:hypothetical protein